MKGILRCLYFFYIFSSNFDSFFENLKLRNLRIFDIMSVNLLIFSIRILLSHTILHMSGCRSLSHTEMYAKLKKAIKCMFAFQCFGWYCPDFIFCGIIYMHQASSQRQCIWGKF